MSDNAAAWYGFQKAWTACVGTPGYDKDVWKAAERQLLAAIGPRGRQGAASCRRCLTPRNRLEFVQALAAR